MFQHIGACGNSLVFQEFWNVRRTCLLAVSFLFFLHRHDDVTPSWFRALESHVLRVPNGNGMKSGLHHLLYPHHLCWFGFWLLHGSSILVCIFIVQRQLAHLSGCHTRPSQSRAICRTWSCKLDASSESQARRENKGDNSGVSVEIWVCGLLFLMITLEFFKVIGVH